MGGLTYNQENEEMVRRIEKSMMNRNSFWNRLENRKPSFWLKLRWKWNSISNAYYETKWFVQTIFRGYSDRDCWDIDHYIARKALPVLKKFIKNLHGYPSNLCNHPPEVSCEDFGCTAFCRWHLIVGKIIEAFEYIIEDDYMYDSYKQRTIEEGLDLFRKYYFSLWD
jgi:hypothetical protein